MAGIPLSKLIEEAKQDHTDVTTIASCITQAKKASETAKKAAADVQKSKQDFATAEE